MPPAAPKPGNRSSRSLKHSRPQRQRSTDVSSPGDFRPALLSPGAVSELCERYQSDLTEPPPTQMTMCFAGRWSAPSPRADDASSGVYRRVYRTRVRDRPERGVSPLSTRCTRAGRNARHGPKARSARRAELAQYPQGGATALTAGDGTRARETSLPQERPNPRFRVGAAVICLREATAERGLFDEADHVERPLTCAVPAR